MNITVPIAGVHDPKWPIAEAGSQFRHPSSDNQIMSPFDEAALEMALRIRDHNSEALVNVHVAGGLAGGKIARSVAAFNPAAISTFSLASPWDQFSVAEALATICSSTDLVLIGREFGDFDDGFVPSVLAAKLGVAFFGRAQSVEAKSDISMVRDVGYFEERCTVSDRMVVSVTNDRRTRLRKPLMKNVMLARQTAIADVACPPSASSAVKFVRATLGNATRAATTCNLIGGTHEQQAEALVSLFSGVRA